MGKYEALGRYLDRSGLSLLTLSFSEIQDILAFPLPKSASRYRPWWANDESHVQACDGWMKFGYRTELVRVEDNQVTFRKTESKSFIPFEASRRVSSNMTPRDFELVARKIMGDYLGLGLRPGKKEGWPKLFDLVSDDFSVVGDAKYLSMVRGKHLPPAKLSVIAEHVWMLEKIDASVRFLVFGNDKRVPGKWLKRYGYLNDLVEFYFISDDETVSILGKV